MKMFILIAAFIGMTQNLLAASNGLTTTVLNDEKENLLANTFQRTLYVFDLDTTSASKCSNDCAELWPPYIIDANEAKVLVAPLGSILRPNNKIQLTFNGRPLYTYGFDRKAGDDKGDGIGGVWHYLIIKAD